MSDRAATELKFHELLALYRTEVLPDIKEGWEELSESDREAVSNLSSFFLRASQPRAVC